jgi:methyltransferase-like protein
MKIDRIERIKKLQREGYKVEKPHSLVLNNIYALITIVTISLVILIYTTYIQPQKEQPKQTLEEKKRQEYFEHRAKQIALSHKLNNIQKEPQDDNKTTK